MTLQQFLDDNFKNSKENESRKANINLRTGFQIKFALYLCYQEVDNGIAFLCFHNAFEALVTYARSHVDSSRSQPRQQDRISRRTCYVSSRYRQQYAIRTFGANGSLTLEPRPKNKPSPTKLRHNNPLIPNQLKDEYAFGIYTGLTLLYDLLRSAYYDACLALGLQIQQRKGVFSRYKDPTHKLKRSLSTILVTSGTFGKMATYLLKWVHLQQVDGDWPFFVSVANSATNLPNSSGF